MKHSIWLTIGIIIAVIIVFVIVETIFVLKNGSEVPAPIIPRQEKTIGSGKPLRYVVMGDSTSISQGSDYNDGFAVVSTNHLAKTFHVTMLNTGISGATAQEVADKQLDQASTFRPDIALIAVGANDVTHLVSAAVIEKSMQHIINTLKQSNPHVQIVVTASPAVDAVSRFPIGLKQLVELRTNYVNKAFDQLIVKNNLVLAPIAKETRQAFLDDPSLLAKDNFHPNARGYALWNPIVIRAIDQAVGHLKA